MRNITELKEFVKEISDLIESETKTIAKSISLKLWEKFHLYFADKTKEIDEKALKLTQATSETIRILQKKMSNEIIIKKEQKIHALLVRLRDIPGKEWDTEQCDLLSEAIDLLEGLLMIGKKLERNLIGDEKQ